MNLRFVFSRSRKLKRFWTSYASSQTLSLSFSLPAILYLTKLGRVCQLTNRIANISRFFSVGGVAR